nr:mercury methylation corrinoid protein HgcA [Geopsychrobacter electrodiphilus]
MADHRKPEYKLEGFIENWLDTPIGEIPVVARKLNRVDQFGRIAMRWGIGRNHYAVAPGIYAVGTPDAEAEVLISANYKLSFDVLRRSLGSINAWILVIDTKGINVWCAAGKGTFGTDEIIRCVKKFHLTKLVTHRRLIVPQLGAPGVAAHLVKNGCDFNVVYGPVRAQDLPAFFTYNRQATPAMRRVNFTLLDRIVLTPVEITILYRQIFYTALALLLLGGIGSQVFSTSAALIRGGSAIATGFSGLVAGAVITPVLLPWLPGRAFSLKGIWTGLAIAILLGGSLLPDAGSTIHIALLLQVTAISSYAAMNFTGSSTYTSPSGVEKEMRIAIPCQLIAVVIALGLWLWTAF